jgi:hypothetical protein
MGRISDGILAPALCVRDGTETVGLGVYFGIIR